ncbi:helix-turn-helix domain-containing protein [Haladaptatus sp. DYF46]|uniref:helix-turn-helix transcriptional regulator n=1 Tax=Haladaptatus sp. DYF46 TaxID=2886041 RepID=UPI001E3736AF
MILVVFLVVGVALVPASVGGKNEVDTGRIISIQRTGNAVATTNDNTTYVWQSEQYVADVTFQVYANEDKYSVCLYDNRTDSDPKELDCQSTTVGNGSKTTVTLNGSNATEPGKRTLYFRLQPTFGSDVPTFDSRTINQTVIRKDDDLDDDGLTNEFEVSKIQTEGWPRDAFLDSDMDGDGLDDGEELNKRNTNPVNKDSDSDGVLDGKEILIGTNPRNADTDGDGLDDGKDPKPTDPTITSSASMTTGTTAVGTSKTSGGFSGMQLLLVGVIGVGIVGAAVMLWRTGQDSYDGNDDPDSPTSVPAGNGGSPPAAEPEDDEPDDILTDEGRVLNLLSENRGRMKQVDIVEETGWSKSKVSRLLSRMEERGDINRLRVGRGNIVYLEGAKPSGARSPREEDSYS